MFPRMGAGSANHEDALVDRAGSGAVESQVSTLALENLALRQQLAVLQRSGAPRWGAVLPIQRAQQGDLVHGASEILRNVA
jgi:hypothetical protein